MFQYRHVAENFYRLKSPGNPLPGNLVRLQPGDILVIKYNLAGLCRQSARDKIKQRGFARPSGPIDPESPLHSHRSQY